MTRYDVVVVGGGPAGSTAALHLARGGARVCVVEKARFPRPKPCGGAVSPRTLQHLPLGFKTIIRTAVRRAIFTYRSGRPFEVVSPNPMGYMVCREEFDEWLKTKAEEAGAFVREGVPVRAVEEGGGQFTIRVGRDAVSAATVIGADGANSLVAKQFFPRRPAARYIALEAEVPQDGRAMGDTVLVDVGAYPGGYAWAFSKGDRINLGVMMEYSRGRELRAAFAGFVAGQSAVPAVRGVKPQAAPVAAPRSTPVPCARRGVLLAGDAAHLADPFLGEGIYYAIRSGSLAAAAVLQAPVDEDPAATYAGHIEAQLWPDLVAASGVARLFHCMPRWWHHVLARMPGSVSEVAGVLAGERTYAGMLHRVVQRVEARAGHWVRRRLGVGTEGPTGVHVP